MATTTMTDTRPTFSRLTEGKATQSWRAAVPAVVVIVAFVALIAYLASSVSTYSQRWMNSVRDAQETRNQSEGLSKQIAQLQKDAAMLKTAGRTTVILEATDKKTKSWAAATVGELADGKTFIRVSAYGLDEKPEGGKAYHAWLKPQTGDSIDLGDLEPDQNGGGYTMASELPAIDQGKSVLLTLDASGAKQPDNVIAKIDLPKLTPSVKAPPTEQPAQAKTGTTSQQMHQELGK
ncbi:MAG: hypothetical protein E6J88_13810 [Deltaproteobacteria bacterium]|nr:MAG: hypothetical protein E6J88_13810 [Deltaproteobacteria bacterium]